MYCSHRKLDFETPMNLANRLISTARRPWIRNTAAVLFAIFVLYGLFGYLVLPGIIKSQGEKAIAAALHRRLTIERVDVRPYALDVSIHGVKLMEPDGQGVFASFQELQVRVSAASLVHLAPVIKEVHLAGPFVHLRRMGPNRYSTDDIVAAVSARKSAGQGAVAGVERGARFSVYNIRIDGGRVEFDDQPEHAHHTVADLKLGIPFISSLPSQEEVFVEPLLSAVINGAPLLIQGRARPFAEPREAVVNLDLERVDLSRYLQYLPFEPRFKMPGAQLDLHLQASFQQPRDRPAALILTGKAAIGGLQVTSLDDQPILKLPLFVVELGNVDLLGGRIEISRVSAAGLDLNVIRDARGQINLAMLAPPDEPSSAAPVTATPAAGPSAPPGGAAIHVAIGQIVLQDAAVRFSNRDPARPLAASVDQFALRIADTALDLQARQLAIGQLDSDSARFRLQQGRTGVASPDAGDRASESAAVSSPGRPTGKTAAPAQAGAPPWNVSVGRVSLANWNARIESRGLPQLAVTTVHALTLAAENLSTIAGAPGKIELKARVNQRGSLSIAGGLGLIPVHADLALDLNGVDLLALQPYITERINLLVTQADLSMRARLMLDQNPDGSFKGGFQGEATLRNLATIDKLDASDFLSWKSLFLGGLNVRMAPLSVNIDQIALSDFFARVIVDSSGRINLQDIVRSSPGEQRSLTTRDPQVPATPTTPAVSTPEPAAVAPIRIRQVTLKAGSVRYTDNFIKPNYTANLVDLGGAITGLSSQADSSATVELTGQVNSAPLTIAGQINPIKGDLFIDLKASVHDMELAPLSPYSGKYAGYGIERGKLSFDVAYKLEHRQLSAENRLVLDQLTFGDKVESPTATTLPVQLAVALLKDRNGVIDVNLPIGGSLDDPQFSVGGVIVKVIVNLVTKAVTAPFALLGKLFGGGEELSFIEFDPGRAEIAAAGETRLKSLATALNERPGLKLQIGAWVEPATDREGLRRQKLDRSVRTMKVKDLVGKGQSATVESVIVSPEEYPVLLERLYKAQNLPAPGSASGTQQALPPGEIENSLLASQQISDDELTALGNRRAQSVKQWLQNTGQVPEQRLFLVATRVGASADANPPGQSTAKTSRIEFSLK
jgi:uncharacterized protein involved in outer membrane biogenesis